MKPTARFNVRKVLSLLLVLIMLLAESNGMPLSALQAIAQEVSGETQTPAPEETQAPTEKPTQAPTQKPTEAPTQQPTEALTEAPTQLPTEAPTQAPTQQPTEEPTQEPTQLPTEAPTEAPGETVAPEAPEETSESTEAPSEPMKVGLMMVIEERGDTTFADALTATQWAAQNSFVYLPNASVASDQPIATGTPFVYRVYYGTLSAPLYDPGDGNGLSAYNYYDDVAIQVVAPDNIKLIDNNGNLIANPGDTALIPVSSRLTAGGAGSITFQGVMIDNGLSTGGTLYDPLRLSIRAEVSVSGETVDFDQAIAAEDNSTSVVNKADNAWAIDKTAGSNEPAISGSGETALATFTYTIEAGKQVSGSISGSAGDYNKYGALNFTSGGYTLTDTLPTFMKDGVEIKPQSSFIALLDGSGNATTTVSGGAGETTLAITAYRTTQLDAAYAGVGDAPAANQTPFFSRYRVSVSYFLKDLTLPYGSDLEDDPDTFTLNNAATLSYTLYGTGEQTASDSASIIWKKTTPPGQLAILKFIPFNGDDQPYDAFWKTVFPGGAEFAVYKAADWDGSAPKSGATPAANYSLLVNDASHTVPLEPGSYVVWETTAPGGTSRGPSVPVNVVSGEKTTAQYFNAASYGLLTFNKLGAGGAQLAGAEFALKLDGNPVATAKSNIDGSVYLSAPAGTYQLVETLAPSGYVKMDPISVTVHSGTTTSIDDIVNEMSTATLSVSKYAVTREGSAPYASEDITGIQNVASVNDFSFTLSWSESGGGVVTNPSQVIALGANGSATVPNLKRVDADGNWISYTLTENAPGDSAFQKDATAYTWTFTGSYKTLYAASFFNVLKGTLRIKKQQMDLDAAAAYPSGKGFKLYRMSGSDYVEVASMTTGSGGTAEAASLAIDDPDGSPIQYYVVEDPDPAYTVVYPGSANIVVGGNTVAAWPVTLGFQKITNKTATPVVNNQNLGKIEITKTNADGSVKLAGGKFKVYTLSGEDRTYLNGGNAYVTDGSGKIVVSPVSLGVAYHVEEVDPPADYLLGAVTIKDCTLSTPFEVGRLNFANDRKPQLSLTKTLYNLATLATTSGSGVTFGVYQLTGGNTFTAVNPAVSFTTNSGGAATAYLPDAGTFYLKETFPAGVLRPGMEPALYPSFIQGDDGNHYYGPITASRNATASVAITNSLNRGRIDITKRSVKSPHATLNGAKFTISVTPPAGDTATQVLLTALGFTGSGTYSYVTAATAGSGTVSVEGMPIYASNNSALVYTVTETTPPTGYFADPTSQTATFVTATDRVFEMTFSNTPKVSLSVNKVGVDKYASRAHEVQLPLAGAVLDVYKKTVNGSNVTLAYETNATTSAAGQVTFSNLDGLSTYVIFERTPPAGYELPDGKSVLSSAGALNGTYSTDAYNALLASHYSTAEYNFASTTNTSYTYPNKLVNYIPYAQFRLNKFDSVNTTTPLNHAKYRLFSSLVSAGNKSFSQLQSEGALTAEGVTYETGNEAGASGSFLTNPQTYGKVYWLYETAAPSGYILPGTDDSRVIGPLTPEGTGWGTYYTKNGLTTVSAYNTAQGGGGTGSERYLQIEINKILNSTGGTFIKNLPGAKFELWLADGTSVPVLYIGAMTTGADMGKYSDPGQIASVAGRAISESFDMAALYADLTYGQYVTRTGSLGAYDYSARFVLKETAYPKDATPQKSQWALTASTAGAAYTVNTYYTGGNSIPNIQTLKIPVRVRKVGYNVASPATLTPLQGVVIGIFSTSNAELMRGTTDQDGYVSFLVDPSASYYAKEITAIAGYDKPATNRFDFTAGTYGTTVADILITNPLYRKLTVVKRDPNGNTVANAKFRILKSDGTQIKDSNGALITPDTITTDANGSASIMLPAGTYRVDEQSIGAHNLSATEQAYFKLVNPSANAFALTAANTAEFTLNVTNPATGALNLTKTDDAGAVMGNVAFAVQFKAFASLAESPPSYNDAGFSSTGDWLAGFAGTATWTTDANGFIVKNGLLPGWYKLTETVPTGYVSTGVTPFVVKVAAKGIGQPDYAPAIKSVVNARKGYVTLTKSFLEPVTLESLPSTVTFRIYTDAARTIAASPSSVAVTVSGRTSSATFAIDPGTYYIAEESGGWYARYSVNGGAEQWLDASFPITVASGNTQINAVPATVTNNLRTATVTLKKLDDAADPNPVEGAAFAIYYLDDSSSKVYLGAPVTTGADGIASLTVTLPKARVILDRTTYYLEEVSAPPQYKLADPVELTLTPGASLSFGDLDELTIVDETALVIDLVKYGKTRAHAVEDPATLSGATFELYKVDTDAGTGVLVASATTDAGGALRFGNLPKLSGAFKYSLRESATPTTHVSGSLQLYNGDAQLGAESVSVGGSQLSLYPVAQAENNVALKGYNTPKGSVAVLKYNYIDPKNASAVPLNATFQIKNAQGAVVGTVMSSQHLPAHPSCLDGGNVTYTGGNYFTGTNGFYYSAAILKNLEPGQYTVTETGAATGFLLPAGTGASDPWRTSATVTVGDNGEAAVTYFANVPNTSVSPLVQKSVYAIGGVPLGGAPAQINSSLQKGEQRITFEITNIASTPSNLFLLPIEQLILEDKTLSFKGLNQTSQTVDAQVTHFVTQVTVGKASYLTTPLSNPPSGDAAKVTAKVYGVSGGSQTLVATVNVTNAAQAVAFPVDTYGGFQIVYTASVGGMLQPGFALDPVLAEMRFVQTDDASVVPAREIKNTVNAKLTYRLGTDQYDSGWKFATTAATIVPDEALPRASIAKTAVKLDVVNGVRNEVNPGSPDVIVQPGDWLRYKVTLTNESDLPIENPVLVDKLPAMLGVDLANVSYATTSSGLTAHNPGSYTDGDGVSYVYLNLTGSLAAHKSVTMTIDGTVRLNSVVTNLSAIENNAYAASTARVKKNVLNPCGTPFTDVNGVLPANLLDGSALGGATGESYQAIAATKTVGLMQTSELKIYKMVAADVSGMGNYASADEYAIANVRDGSGKGLIKYQIVIVNGSTTTPATKVRMVDRMPVIGDTATNGLSRLSRWPVAFGGNVTAVDDTGTSVYFKLYSNTGALSTTELMNAAKNGPTGWSSGAGESSKAILLDFSKNAAGQNYSLKPGGKIIITYTAWAPHRDLGEETLDDYYFEASVNDAGVAVDGALTVYSGPAKVVLMPEPVSIGNRVWIDKNMNGVQDGSSIDDPAHLTGEPSYTGGGITVSLMKYFNSDVSASVAGSTSLDGSGFYQFSGLTPADLKSGVTLAEAYDAQGNILNSKLKGSGRVSYQLKVTGVPDGYFVTAPFALNGGVAPNHETGSGRESDNNFSKSGDTWLSEKFYLPPGQSSLSFDLGLCRVRDLEIEKRGSDNAPLSGVAFSVYGPFTAGELTAGVTVGEGNKVTTLTTDASGMASLVSTPAKYLNYYDGYVVVETNPAAHFDATQLQATGGNPAASTLYSVTGGVIDGKNYFVLPPKTGQEARKDTVGVVNQYVAGGSVTIEGSKALTGRALQPGEFSFTLTDVTDPENSSSVSTTNDASGAFSFDLEYELGDIGVHTYKVAEVPGGVANHTYDETVYTVTVTVSDSSLRDGVLNVEKEITHTDETQPSAPAAAIAFLNGYADTISETLSGTKALTGRAIEDGDFSFQLTDVTDEENPVVLNTVENDGESFQFPALDYDQGDIGKTFAYEVTEVDGGIANHEYDDTVYRVTIAIGYDADTGELTKAVTTYRDEVSQDGGVLAFSNTYAATISHTLSGKKTLTGRAIADGDFSFQLTDVTDEQNPVDLSTVQNVGGNFQFTALAYDQGDIGKTFAYEVTELDGGVGNHVYDDTVYRVTVAIGYDEDTGELTKTVTTEKDDVPQDGGLLTFANTYADSISHTLSGTKTLTGRAIANRDFSFRLTDVTNSASPVDVSTVQNLGGSFQFPALMYDQDDIGKTFTYRVSELNRGVANHGYDGTVYTVSIAIGYDAATGELTKVVATQKNGAPQNGNALAFANTYAGTISHTLSGIKTLAGRAIANGEFSFKLTDVTNSLSPVDLSTVGNVGGNFQFPALAYDQDDIGKTFTYRVSEISRGVGGFTYDATVYSVTVAIGYAANTGELTKLVRTYKNSAQTPEQTNNLGFANGYAATGSYTPVGVKALEGRAQLDGMFRFEVRDNDNGGALVSTGVSNASGQIAFTAIQYQKNAGRDDTGTHRYTITEIAGNAQGIDDTGVVYSSQSFPLTVVVDDNAGNGQLRVQASYPSGSAQFQNATEKVDVTGSKRWVDQSNLYAKRPANVTVTLLADGEALDSATLSGAGDAWSYSFTGLPRYDYSDPYDVREIAYTVDESAVPGYFKAIAPMTVSAGEGGRHVLGYDITNTLRLVTISKRTAGGDRLSGATLALYRVVSGARTLIETFRSATGSDHVVSGLEPGSYLLVETVVPAGYVRAADIAITIADNGTVTSSALTGGVVRMIDELIPTADVSGTKTWVDLSNQSGQRPEDIEITLFADGVPVPAQPSWVKDGDIWTYTYTGLNVYRTGNSGPRIAYTVQEAPVTGYAATYNGLGIVNQLTDIEVRFVEISGRKTWVDDGDAAGARPDSITVYLLRNGTPVDSRVVTGADGWAYSFGSLPSSDGLMTAYTYTVNEKPVAGYARSVRDFNLTNTYVPPSEEPPTEPKKKPTYTPENWEELVTLLDAEVPLYGGLLKTGEETPLYPYVFGGLGLIALIVASLTGRRRRKRK